MSLLTLRPPDDCRWDLIALGEVMLRFDPGDMRINTTRQFQVFEGGGEYNVARGLAGCFGMRTGIVTALADNAIGRLVEDLIRQGGVEQTNVRWVPYDGVGRSVRNGLNFVERGFGVRPGVGCSDRGNSAVSQLRPGDIDWDEIFGQQGARWFHCGGVFAGLSESTADVARDAMKAAKRHGTIVSYDVNYRPSLWAAVGGPERAAEVNQSLFGHTDVLFGIERRISSLVGGDLRAPESVGESDADSDAALLSAVVAAHPNLAIAAATVRRGQWANREDLGAVCVARTGLHLSPVMTDLEILDRVGAGDSFAAGVIYGLMTDAPVERALAYGVAHSALTMTTPGDNSMATLDEVRRIIEGGAPLIIR